MREKKTTEQFILEATAKFDNRFDYSLVNYELAHKKIQIICNNCKSIFEQTPDRHLQNIGDGSKICPNCGKQRTTQWFIEKAKEIHEDRYDYTNVQLVRMLQSVNIKCKSCGLEFQQVPHDHIYNQIGCPKCKLSKGELKVKKFLIDKDIEFVEQKRFKDCRNKIPLPFDFYLPNHNICIEYDGAHHFLPHSYRKNATHADRLAKLFSTQYNDNIKTLYCAKNNIKLIRLNASNIDKELSSALLLLYQNHVRDMR